MWVWKFQIQETQIDNSSFFSYNLHSLNRQQMLVKMLQMLGKKTLWQQSVDNRLSIISTIVLQNE